jgi:hypothetical protein
VRDNYSKGGLGGNGTKSMWKFGRKVQLPEEQAGIVMVFKAFDKMSYALVMEATKEIKQGDRAKNP